MSRRSGMLLGGLAVLSCLLFGLLVNQPLTGQPPPAVLKKEGRFQLVTGGSGFNQAVLCDTETGQCWVHQLVGGNRWVDLGSPVAQK